MPPPSIQGDASLTQKLMALVDSRNSTDTPRLMIEYFIGNMWRNS